jgi:hypothetical protein
MKKLKAPNWALHIVCWGLTPREVHEHAKEIEEIFRKHLRPCVIMCGETQFRVGARTKILFSFPTEFGLKASPRVPVRFEIKSTIPCATDIIGQRNASAILETKLIDLAQSWENRDGVPVLVDSIL